MAKRKAVKKVAKPVVVQPKVEKPKVVKAKPEPKIDLKELARKRDEIIASIQPKLLTNAQLKSGGSTIRVRYAKEQGYVGCLDEVNVLGAKLGLRPIGLGHLRK